MKIGLGRLVVVQCVLSVILVAGSSLLGGCGYTLAGRGNNIPEDIQKVFLASLENETSRSQVEQILTDAISNELVTRRRFEVVNSGSEADAVLKGKVLDFSVIPVTFDANGLANNFEITISADMVFQRVPGADGQEGEVIWKNARYLFREDYPLEEGDVAFFDRENLAIEETSIRFAETMVTDLLEGF